VSAESSFSYLDHGPVDDTAPDGSTLATIVAFLRRLFRTAGA
jgi:hypothetical protein